MIDTHRDRVVERAVVSFKVAKKNYEISFSRSIHFYTEQTVRRHTPGNFGRLDDKSGLPVCRFHLWIYLFREVHRNKGQFRDVGDVILKAFQNTIRNELRMTDVRILGTCLRELDMNVVENGQKIFSQ